MIKLPIYTRAFRLALFSFTAFCFVQCSSDDPFEASIIVDATAMVSGNVMVDIDTDGLGDLNAENIVVLLGFESAVDSIPNAASGFENTERFLYTTTDANGDFQFPGLPPVQNWVLTLSEKNRIISAVDKTPDNENSLPSSATKIRVSLDEFEHDANNNFIISPE